MVDRQRSLEKDQLLVIPFVNGTLGSSTFQTSLVQLALKAGAQTQIALVRKRLFLCTLHRPTRTTSYASHSLSCTWPVAQALAWDQDPRLAALRSVLTAVIDNLSAAGILRSMLEEYAQACLDTNAAAMLQVNAEEQVGADIIIGLRKQMRGNPPLHTAALLHAGTLQASMAFDPKALDVAALCRLVASGPEAVDIAHVLDAAALEHAQATVQAVRRCDRALSMVLCRPDFLEV